MKAVVLVGGFGSRLRPLTIDVPKQMIPVVGVTMLERVLRHLRSHGVEEAVLALGYLPDVFQEAFPSGESMGVKLRYSVESEPLDTAGAVRLAVDTAQIDSTFLVVNGDILSSFDLSSLVRFHKKSKGMATIALTPVDDPSRFGVVVSDKHGRVHSFVEKPALDSAPTNLINAGAYVFEPEALTVAQVGVPISMERLVFPELAKHRELFALEMPGYWIDAGTPASLLKVSLDILKGNIKGSDLSGLQSAGEGLDGSVSVDPLVSVKGSYVGRDCVFEGIVDVRNSVLEEGVTICSQATVRDSVVLPGAVVGEGALIDCSIVGHGAIVPPGSIVVNGSVVSRYAELTPGCQVVGERIPS